MKEDSDNEPDDEPDDEDEADEDSDEHDAQAQAVRGPCADSSDEDDPPTTSVTSPSVKVGVTVHIPHSVFPDEEEPELGYWIGKTVHTSAGGQMDTGILAEGEDEVFTRSMTEVSRVGSQSC